MNRGKLLLAVGALVCGASCKPESPSPEESPQAGRFVLQQGNVADGPVLLKMDTWTGETWNLHEMPVMSAKGNELGKAPCWDKLWDAEELMEMNRKAAEGGR